jgi:hypothetical protein
LTRVVDGEGVGSDIRRDGGHDDDRILRVEHHLATWAPCAVERVSHVNGAQPGCQKLSDKKGRIRGDKGSPPRKVLLSALLTSDNILYVYSKGIQISPRQTSGVCIG